MTAITTPFPCSFVCEPSQDRSEYVIDRLREFNQTRKSPLWSGFSHTTTPLEIYAIDDNNSVIGGLIGETNGVPEWLNVSVVWVTQEQRGHGMGRELMRLAEEEAKRRSCRYARLASSDFQAPEFYQKIGYRIYGRLENCPQGETVYYFYKQLV